MTEREEIAELVHRYSDGVTRRDVTQWADCFADDARWEIKADRVAVGRDAIVAQLLAAFDVLEGVVQNVLHGEVVVDGATASGRWHIQEHYRRTNGVVALLLAHYDDTYARVDGRWRFTSRTLVRHYEGPPDLSGTFHITERTHA